MKYIFCVSVINPSSPNSLSASSSDDTRSTGEPSTRSFLISSGPKRQLKGKRRHVRNKATRKRKIEAEERIEAERDWKEERTKEKIV